MVMRRQPANIRVIHRRCRSADQMTGSDRTQEPVEMTAARAALDARKERARPHSHKALSEGIDYWSFHISTAVVVLLPAEVTMAAA